MRRLCPATSVGSAGKPLPQGVELYNLEHLPEHAVFGLDVFQPYFVDSSNVVGQLRAWADRATCSFSYEEHPINEPGLIPLFINGFIKVWRGHAGGTAGGMLPCQQMSLPCMCTRALSPC